MSSSTRERARSGGTLCDEGELQLSLKLAEEAHKEAAEIDGRLVAVVASLAMRQAGRAD